MNTDKAIIILKMHKTGESFDVEIPLDITANELIIGLNKAYDLGMNTEDIIHCFSRAENPIALLKGNKKLSDFGIRNATVINIK